MTDDHFARHSLVHQHGELTKENAKLRARIAELMAALKPFADKVDGIQRHVDDGLFWPVNASVGDLRAARAAYLGEKND